MLHLISADTFDFGHFQHLAQVMQAFSVRLFDDHVVFHVVQADEKKQLDPDALGVRQGVFTCLCRDAVIGQEADDTPDANQVGLAVFVRLFAARLNQVDLFLQGQVRLALELGQQTLLQVRPEKKESF